MPGNHAPLSHKVFGFPAGLVRISELPTSEIASRFGAFDFDIDSVFFLLRSGPARPTASRLMIYILHSMASFSAVGYTVVLGPF